MKNLDARDPEKILKSLQQTGEFERHQDLKVNIRVNESVAPAKFRSDPLLPGGYIANSLTIRAMRQDIFVLGDSVDVLAREYACACGEILDVQFWRLCPYCGRGVDGTC